jgi:predicted HAD superfamily Cof-like phosphohydrolase
MEKQLMQVRAWQKAVGAPLPEKPTMLDEVRAKLRQDLLEEEVQELKDAKDLNDVADAICDILYITYGTAHEYGMADRLALMFDEVHSSNMSKMGEDGNPIYREDGKVLKPDTFRPPNLRLILNRRFHLFTNMEHDFEDVIREINEAQTKRWQARVDAEIKSHLGWFSKIKLWIMDKLKKKVTIANSFDGNYNNVVTITSKRKGTTKIDDVVDY